MSYRHFGRIGDIWKHIPLCEFLAIEQPINYIETNSAYPEYQLTGSFEQQYGILHIEKNIQQSQLIQDSVFWKVLSSVSENKNGFSKYLGSPALALNILQVKTRNFIFFDIEYPCLRKIGNYVNNLNINSQVTLKNEDSINGLVNISQHLNFQDFIHVDPYLIHEKNPQGNSYFEAFVKAIRQGVMGMLWYGFNTVAERTSLHNGWRSQINNTGKITLQGIEIVSILLEEGILDVNPGIWGCGILIGNLSEESRRIFPKMAREVINIYQDSIMFDKYSGELKLEEFEIQV